MGWVVVVKVRVRVMTEASKAVITGPGAMAIRHPQPGASLVDPVGPDFVKEGICTFLDLD